MNKKNTSPLEAWEQEQIFIFKQCNQNKYPDLELLNGSMCGVRLMPGQRVKAKRQGMTKGFPDIFLPVRNKTHSGLFVELKRLRGSIVSQEQKTWLKRLNAEGYYAVVARGHKEAIGFIKDYLGIK